MSESTDEDTCVPGFQFEDSTKKVNKSVFGSIRWSLLRTFAFLYVAFPVAFLALIATSALFMPLFESWTYDRSFRFMAGAITGGAVLMPADAPLHFVSKTVATLAGSSGVGLFGFMVGALGNGVADPLVKALKLDSGTPLWLVIKFCVVSMGVIAASLIFALSNGCLLALAEGWGWWTGFKGVASIELGGGIVFSGMQYPHAFFGMLIYCVIGSWSVGLSTLMITIAESPSANIMKAVPSSSVWRLLSRFAILVLICLPLVLSALMLFVAAVMALFTSWTFQDAFWSALPAVSGGAASLSAEQNPTLDKADAIILISAACIGSILLSLTIGLGSHFVEPLVQVTFLGKSGGIGKAVLGLVGICYIAIPLVVFSLSIPIGGVLALVEGWKFEEGIWWCVAVQLGGGMALSSAPMVATSLGMLTGVMVVAWSIGVSILSIGLVDTPLVHPLMDALGMVVTLDKSSQQTEFASAKVAPAP